MTCVRSIALIIPLVLGIWSQAVFAQGPLLSPPDASTFTLSGEAAYELGPRDNNERQSHRWLILMCGLPGDDAHRERLTAAVIRIASAAEVVFNVDPQRLTVLVGDQAMAEAVSGEVADPAVCTRQSVESTFRQLGTRVAPGDSCWVVLLGHGQLYAGRSTLNIEGPDFDATELARWAQRVQCNERVFFATMPTSGFWLKPLAGPRTVTISATDADFEITGTEMPYALANVLSGNAETQPLVDVDEDGQLSLLDLYLAVNLEIHGRFKSLQRLQTEHAQLDDNGDGRGSELQAPFTAVEAEGEDISPRQPPKPPTRTTNRDGDYSRSIVIRQPSTPAVTGQAEATANAAPAAAEPAPPLTDVPEQPATDDVPEQNATGDLPGQTATGDLPGQPATDDSSSKQ